MIKTLFVTLLALACVLGLTGTAQADYATTPQPYPNQPYPPAYPQPYPQPYYPQPMPYPQPYPYYGPYVGPVTGYYPVQPMVMCYAQGLANGAMFYGVGMNYMAAQQWAMYACTSTGQYCRITGCR